MNSHQLKLLIIFILISSPNLAANYYVNDATLNGDDIYTTAVGASGNTGLSASSPKALPSQVIALGGLAGGDTIFIDAGNFIDELLIDGLSGSAGNYIVFTGVDSTKTTITGVAGTNASAPHSPKELVIQLNNSDYISVENMNVQQSAGNDWGIQIYNDSDYNTIKGVRVIAYYGIDVFDGANSFNEVQNCFIDASYVGVRLKNGADDTHIFDCTILTEAASVFAAMEIQSANDNLIERCIISTTGTVAEGTIHAGKFATGNKFYNNYILNNTAGHFALDSDFGDELDLVHNSIYSAGSGINYEHITPGDHVINITMESNIIQADGGYPIVLPDVNDKFTLMDNNLFYSSTGDVAQIAGSGYDLAAWKTFDPDGAGAGSASNSLYGDPNWTDIGARNLTISAGSPAENASTNARGFTLDLKKSSRPLGGTSDIGADEFDLALPIDLGDFNGVCLGSEIVFRWNTFSETNNDYFTLEGRDDFKGFSELQFVPGAGNSTETIEYRIMISASEGFFRLRQTDYDGTSTYSDEVYLQCEVDKLTIAQAGHQLVVSAPAQEGLAEINLWTLNGRLVESIKGAFENERITISLNGFSEKFYLVDVSYGNLREAKKILVR